MKTLLDLAKSLEKKAKRVETAANEAAIDAALSIISDLAIRTPVDTSKALSNWILTLNSPSSAKIDAHVLGVKGSSKNASASQTIANAKVTLAKKKPGQDIYITNNLPYIKRLNDGYSKQAPAGFVERSVLIGRKKISNFKIKGF